MTTSDQMDLAGLQKAQGEARLALAAAEKAELELAKIKSPSPLGIYDELGKLKGLLPSGTPAAPATSNPPEQLTYLPAFVYGALGDAVKAVAKEIKDAERSLELRYKDKDFVLYWMDDDLIQDARAYLNLLAKAHAMARLYSELLKPKPFDLKDFGITSILVGVYGLQALAAGVASAQGIAQAFSSRTGTRADSVDIDAQVFQDFLRTELTDGNAELANQIGEFVWDLKNTHLTTLMEDGNSPLGHALKGLLGLLDLYTDPDKEEARKELRKAVTELVESMMLTGLAALRRVEQVSGAIYPPSSKNVNGSVSKTEVVFVTARVLKAGAVVVVKDASFIDDRKVSVDAFIVTTFTVSRPDGTIVASDLVVTRKSSRYEPGV